MSVLYATTSGQHHPPKTLGRFEELDALRGLAALSVFFSHAFGIIDPPALFAKFEHSPIRMMWDGAAAVDLFFVLSGFVLALPYVSRAPRPLRYDVFLIKRVFRLYPAFWVAIFLSLVLLHFGGSLRSLPYASEWLAAQWPAPPGSGQVLRTMTLIIPGIDDNAINPVFWSLIVEMRMSLIFPLLVLAVGQLRKPGLDVMAVLVAIVSGVAAFFLHVGLIAALPHFVLGIAIAKHRDQLTAWAHSRSVTTAWGLGIVAMALYGNRAILPGVLNVYGLDIVAAAMGAGLLIVLAMSRGQLTRFLHLSICRFYGRISYSFYLVHLPIMLFSVFWLWRFAVPVPIIALLALAATTTVSAAMFAFIEMPFLRLGHRCTRIWGGGRAQ